MPSRIARSFQEQCVEFIGVLRIRQQFPALRNSDYRHFAPLETTCARAWVNSLKAQGNDNRQMQNDPVVSWRPGPSLLSSCVRVAGRFCGSTFFDLRRTKESQQLLVKTLLAFFHP